LKKITNVEALSRFNNGKPFVMVASKCSPSSMFALQLTPYLIKNMKREGNDFKKLCNSFSYYNCNEELGETIHFYMEG
jgi:hypothetical protein